MTIPSPISISNPLLLRTEAGWLLLRLKLSVIDCWCQYDFDIAIDKWRTASRSRRTIVGKDCYAVVKDWRRDRRCRKEASRFHRQGGMRREARCAR